MAITPAEIAETRGMVEEQNLDIRTITMGVSLMGCGDENLDRMCTKIYDHVTHTAEHLVETAENLEREYGIPIVNKRVSVTPVAQIAACCKDEDLTPIAHALDRAAETLGIDYLGGFSALVQKGIGDADRRVIQSIPQALATTSRVCSSVNVASLRAGINMDAVLMAAQTIIDAAKLTADQDSVGASKFVCFANMVEDSPFMAGAVHGGGEADAVINVGVSGPGVMAAALETLPDSASMMEVAEKIKQTAFKITRAGELMSREAARRLGVEKGIVDLSLAPTPAIGDSVARILEIIGRGHLRWPRTTCALAMLNDAVKKGGVMASSSVGGLSGAFIPVSEDAGMIAARRGRCAFAREARGHDLRVLRRPGHDRHPRRHPGRDHRRHHRRRDGHRRHQQQDHGRARDSRHRQGRGRLRRVRWFVRPCAHHAGEPQRRHRACPPWWTLPGAAELAEELAEEFGRGAPGRANI